MTKLANEPTSFLDSVGVMFDAAAEHVAAADLAAKHLECIIIDAT